VSLRRTMDPAPPVGEPLRDPVPVAGCSTCQAWAAEREEARASHDWTRVSDCNVHVRRHPH